MPRNNKILLSIGMIVKDEERCLERCLASLRPLRDAIPCQLVVADTGSTDHTWDIAEKYADVLFHFDWVNDFAAARNAVLDRCQGTWCFYLDADEWLDENVQQMVDFLHGPDAKVYSGGTLLVRNYTDKDDLEVYSDFMGARLHRRDSGIRFVGAIHEMLANPDGTPIPAVALDKTFLYHDGYMNLDAIQQKAKSVRNMALLRAELEKAPKDLRRLQQCVESSGSAQERTEYLERALAVLREDRNNRSPLGAVLYSHAIHTACELHKWELVREYLDEAMEWYPDSLYTAIDSQGFGVMGYYAAGDYSAACACGARWEAALAAYQADPTQQRGLLFGTLHFISPSNISMLTAMLFDSCCKIGDWVRASRLLEQVRLDRLVGNNWAVLITCVFAHGGELDNTMPQLQRICDAVLEGVASGSKVWEEKKAYLQAAFNRQFSPAAMGETLGIHRLVAELERCEWGLSARIMFEREPDEVRKLLAQVTRWDEVLLAVYPHVMRVGAPMPERFFRQGSAVLADMASVLPEYDAHFVKAVIGYCRREKAAENPAELTWKLNACAAALRRGAWHSREDGEALCDAFFRVVEDYLRCVYNPGMLCEAYITALPGLHGFGWYCIEAQSALYSGDNVRYLRLLRKGLEIAPAMKGMVSFMTEQMERRETEKQKSEIAQATPELLNLAEQVRGILAAYPADDPAVQALKQSPAYQKVAFLIEEPASQFTM